MTDKRCPTHQESEPVLVLTPKIRHYGRWVCSICDKHIVWARSPKTNEQMEQRQKQIRRILQENVIEDDDFLHKLLTLYSKPHIDVKEKNIILQLL